MDELGRIAWYDARADRKLDDDVASELQKLFFDLGQQRSEKNSSGDKKIRFDRKTVFSERTVSRRSKTRRRRKDSTPAWLAQVHAWRDAKQLCEEVGSQCDLRWLVVNHGDLLEVLGQRAQEGDEEDVEHLTRIEQPIQADVDELPRYERKGYVVITPEGTEDCGWLYEQFRRRREPEATQAVVRGERERDRIDWWIIDSGASNHMVCKSAIRDPLKIRETAAPIVAITANGRIKIDREVETYIPCFVS